MRRKETGHNYVWLDHKKTETYLFEIIIFSESKFVNEVNGRGIVSEKRKICREILSWLKKTLK